MFSLEELRTRTDVKWTYISPAGDFQADGAKTGKYILGGEELNVEIPLFFTGSGKEDFMTQAERLVFLIRYLINENNKNHSIFPWRKMQGSGCYALL